MTLLEFCHCRQSLRTTSSLDISVINIRGECFVQIYWHTYFHSYEDSFFCTSLSRIIIFEVCPYDIWEFIFTEKLIFYIIRKNNVAPINRKGQEGYVFTDSLWNIRGIYFFSRRMNIFDVMWHRNKIKHRKLEFKYLFHTDLDSSPTDIAPTNTSK